MLIGVPKETKEKESRISLTPQAVKTLVDAGHEVHVEKDAGKNCGFSNKEYAAIGAKIKDNVYSCDMIVRVKEPPLGSIKKDQTIMAYLHIEKGQNPPLKEALIKKKTTSYAYECFFDENGRRLINLGFEAGIVGMFEALRLYGKNKLSSKGKGPFSHLNSMRDYQTKEEAYKTLRKTKLDNTITVVVLGKGSVSAGVQEVLKQVHVFPQILWRDRTPFIEEYLPKIDVLVNAITWKPNDPHIVTKDMLKLMKKDSVIIDISCDREGAVETCIPTSWKKPTYKKEGILHCCIDNLPSAMARESSIHLSEMILPCVLKVANSTELKNGLMTLNGQYVYKKKY